MSNPRITFYYDIGSPFSCIAFHVLKNSPTFSKCEVKYVPVLLRGLFQLCQNPPPLAVKNKRKWLNSNRLYWARRFGVPMSEDIPKGFPASTVHLQSALAFVAREYPDKLIPLSEKLFNTFWEEGDISIINTETFTPIFEQELDVDTVKQILDAPNSEAILDDNTQEAFTAGAFGLPWLECTNSEGATEGHWGVDHIGRVVEFLGLDTSADPSFKVFI